MAALSRSAVKTLLTIYLVTAMVGLTWSGELDVAYDSAQYFFDRQEYGQARQVLERVDPLFYPQVVEHLTMLSRLRAIESASQRRSPRNRVSSRDYQRLIDAGLDGERLYRAICGAALADNELSLFDLCARHLPSFSAEVDQAIASWLQRWYSDTSQLAEYPEPLRLLVNADELRGNEADHQLVRQRLVAWLRTNNCQARFNCPAYPAPLRPLVREFIFSRR